MQPERSGDCDIAIIGGGLVGASLALALQRGAAQRGWRVSLIEPFRPEGDYHPSYDARSSALSFGSATLYQGLGVWSSIAARAEPITDIHVSDRGRFGATHLQAAAEGVPALGYVVENAWLGHCLAQALDQQVLDWRCPAEVVAIQPQVQGYRLQLRDGGLLNCRLAVLADGGRSGLAASLGIGQRRLPYGQSALITNLSTAEPHGGRAFERFSESGPMALLPLTEQRCALVWTCQEQAGQQLMAASQAQFLAQLQAAFGYRLGRFLQAGERHLYPLQLVESEEQVRPHLVVLGNAAHSLHPVAGQGFNLSLRDSLALAETLLDSARAPGDFGVLQYYQDQRRDDQWRVVNFSHYLTRLFCRPEPLARVGRNLGLLALDLLPPAKHWFSRLAMGL